MMAGPWEDYKTSASEGPWNDYKKDTPQSGAQPQDQPWYKKAWQWAEPNIVRPGLEYGGMALGGALGTSAGPVGTVGGAGLGYAAGKKTADIIEENTGMKKPTPMTMQGAKQEVMGSAKDVVTGAATEAGGQALGPAVQWGLKKSNLPEMLYKGAAKLSTTLTPKERTEISRTLIKERLPLTDGSYDALRGRVGELNSQIDTAIKPVADKPVDWLTVSGEAQGSIAKARKGSEPSADVKTINDLLEHYRKEWGQGLTVGRAQELKKDLGARLESHFDSVRKGGTKTFSDAEVNAMNDIRRGLRKVIEGAAPEVKSLNAREGSLLGAQESLMRAGNRIENRNPILNARTSMGMISGGLTGAASGNPYAAAVGAGAGLLASPENASRLAIGLDRMATTKSNALWNPNYVRWWLANRKNKENGEVNESPER